MMTTEEYKHLATTLRQYALMRKQGQLSVSNSEADIEGKAADAIEELIEKVEKQANTIRVETPLGILIARSSHGDPDYPGIYVEIRRPDADKDLSLALVEFTETEADIPKTGHIITRVYGDALADEYTNRVVHEKIEDYFMIE